MEWSLAIAAAAVLISLYTSLSNRKGQVENVSVAGASVALAQLKAANDALSDQVDRLDRRVVAAEVAVEDCRRREDRWLLRIVHLEQTVRAAGLTVPQTDP